MEWFKTKLDLSAVLTILAMVVAALTWFGTRSANEAVQAATVNQFSMALDKQSQTLDKIYDIVRANDSRLSRVEGTINAQSNSK